MIYRYVAINIHRHMHIDSIDVCSSVLQCLSQRSAHHLLCPVEPREAEVYRCRGQVSTDIILKVARCVQHAMQMCGVHSIKTYTFVVDSNSFVVVSLIGAPADL